MNRRDFMGTVVGGIAMAKLGTTAFHGSVAQAATQGTEPPQGAWIENGVIDAGGSHEPYLFVVRRGGQSLNAREIYEYQQSEAVMRQLKNDGVEVFHTHLYKGFGMAAEKPDMEATVRTTAIAHRLGMKVDTYVQWDTMMYETFFAEEPRAQGWIQCDQWGQPIMTEYGFQQSFRYRPCFSNQEYIDYLKKVVHYAVVEVKTDFIHFDNFDLSPEPDSCHCNGCKSGFRKFLKTKYSPEQRKERFGFENVDFVNPPLWNGSNRPEKLDIIFDPVFQEWIDYRCTAMADALGQMVALIRPLNPEVAIEINFGGIVGHNNPWTRGNDHSKLLKHTQVFWDEQDYPLEYLPDGRLITTIRTYKMARTYRNVAFTDAEVSEPGVGESLAFNQTIGFAGENPLSAAMVKYISFYRKNRDLYVGTKDVAPVAVFRSHPSITYHNSRAGLSAVLVEQALIQARVSFQLIFDEQLGELSPGLCKVLILPNSECLSDDQLALVRRFVEAGGGLIATEQTGLYDGWRRLRIKPGLLGLVDNQPPAAAYQEEVRNAPVAAGPPSRKQVGRGRVVYFPGIEFDGPLPPPEPYFHIGPEFWKRPKNSKELIDAVSWAAQSDLPLLVTGPDFLAANLVEQPDKRRRLVHLVNYNTKHVPSIENIEVSCVLPDGTSARAVRLYAVGSESFATLDFRMQGQNAAFTVPELNAYCMVSVAW
ncbi:MAG: hypothetical protein ACYCOR_04380 [Acidobacteriaceae bacterium]